MSLSKINPEIEQIMCDNPHIKHRYEVLVMIPQGEVLQSICGPPKDPWSIAGRQVLVAGGGVQFLIPRMNRYLRHPSPIF